MEENNNGSDDKDLKRKAAAELRKANKPLMEKRRRERINTCLDQLKTILMDVTKKESSYYSKLEKADILEMTVKYLQTLKRQQNAVCKSSDPTVMDKYIAGFNECTSEVTSYLNSIEGMTTEVRSRMINHLADCLHPAHSSQGSTTQCSTHDQTNTIVNCPTQQLQNQPQQQMTFTQAQPLQIQTTPTLAPGQNNAVCIINQSPVSHQIQTIQTAPSQAIPVQLVPAKLPSGDTVFVLANTQQIPIIGATPISMTNPTSLSSDFSSTGNVNQNFTVLSNVMQGNVMKIEPTSNICYSQEQLNLQSNSVTYSRQGSTSQNRSQHESYSSISSTEDTSYTDESSSVNCPSSSFESSTSDISPNINETNVRLVHIQPREIQETTERTNVSTTSTVTSGTASHTVSKPLSPDSSGIAQSNVTSTFKYKVPTRSRVTLEGVSLINVPVTEETVMQSTNNSPTSLGMSSQGKCTELQLPDSSAVAPCNSTQTSTAYNLNELSPFSKGQERTENFSQSQPSSSGSAWRPW